MFIGVTKSNKTLIVVPWPHLLCEQITHKETRKIFWRSAAPFPIFMRASRVASLSSFQSMCSCLSSKRRILNHLELDISPAIQNKHVGRKQPERHIFSCHCLYGNKCFCLLQQKGTEIICLLYSFVQVYTFTLHQCTWIKLGPYFITASAFRIKNSRRIMGCTWGDK